MTRKHFIGACATGLPALTAPARMFGQLFSAGNDALADKPVVISTWDFGVAANRVAWESLVGGGKPLDAVEAGVRVAEADLENMTVGSGGYPDAKGIVTLDAVIMGGDGRCGGVAALRDIKHPISVARTVMEKTPHVLLVGEGALQFALANGFPKEELLTPAGEKAWQEWLREKEFKPEINIENRRGGPNNHDTIGMLALGMDGNMAGACSTSGLAFKMHGRVGDSPLVGAGLFVDNEVGAATATGVGEEIIRTSGSFLVVELMRRGMSPEEACKEAVSRIVRKSSRKSREIQVAFVALRRDGRYGAFALQQDFRFAMSNRDRPSALLRSNSYY